MFTIVQSHRTEQLVAQLLSAYRSKNQSIFAEFIVIVPSMVLGDWLDKSIAAQAGISTLVTTKFWGQYQWTLMQKILAQYNHWLEDNDRADEIMAVPEVAVLTGAVMQWRLFGYFTYNQEEIIHDSTHPLQPILTALLEDTADKSQQDQRLWSLATDFSRVFGRYLTHREDWLDQWSNNEAIEVAALIAEKDELSARFDQYAGMTPDWLVAHYTELEAAQRYLWRVLFAGVYQHRGAIESRFWQLMTSDSQQTGVDIKAILPKQLHIFTIQQLPQNELNFLQKLSCYLDIVLLHYNPSQLFWADIVDKQWLERQQVVNPDSVFLRDYGHTLLSRLGKQSRETFAMLAGLSGNEYSHDFQLSWQDQFDIADAALDTAAAQAPSLLQHLQQDVLMLNDAGTTEALAGQVSGALGQQLADQENSASQNSLSKNKADIDENSDPNTDAVSVNTSSHDPSLYSDSTLKNKQYQQPRRWQLSHYDNSLSIHSCHNLQRQLEVLRSMIAHWLNQKNPDGSTRHLSDIVVLLPDVDRHHDLINSVFVDGRGQDGFYLPAKVTGVVDKSIWQLWQAISSFYTLLGSDTARFEATQVLDWLMLPPLYESLGLTHEQMSRGCEMLERAGFIRGFDEGHLKQTLDAEDYDYRFSFSHALDQIVTGLVMPKASMSGSLYPDHWAAGTLPEKTRPMAAMGLSDAPIVEALCRVHQGLDACRYEYQARHSAAVWLERIEDHIIHPFFGVLDQSRTMRTIFNAMNGFKGSLRANRQYQRYQDTTDTSTARIDAQLMHLNNLPLKLNFMLSSIEDELENQQVSAEPTGVITFGRFGALRNVPFGLVVMLNMDLAEFPSRDRDNRYDLMQAGVARRGDRFSEDDDNGAFLDALLCARSACWIFYNGQRLTDSHEQLPANPVSELLEFLKGEVQWQWSPLHQTEHNNDTVMQVQRYMPKLIEEWLVTRHPALPFDPAVFVAPAPPQRALDTDTWQTTLHDAMQQEKLAQQRTHAPARLWQAVFNQLETNASLHDVYKEKKSPVPVLGVEEYQRSAQQLMHRAPNSEHQAQKIDEPLIDMRYLYQQVRHPAKHFLRQQQVHMVTAHDEKARQEPLSLSALSAYHVNAELLAQLARDHDSDDNHVNHGDHLLYDPLLPAGVARRTSLTYRSRQIEQQCRNFMTQLRAQNITIAAVDSLTQTGSTKESCAALLTPCRERLIGIPVREGDTQHQLSIKGVVPSRHEGHPEASLWLNVLPNSARVPHLLRFWLMHVFWQVARGTTDAQVVAQDGRSIWRFNKAAGDGIKKYKGHISFQLAPIRYDDALDELIKWLRFAQISAHAPIVILPSYALIYLEKSQEMADEDKRYLPERKDFSGWPKMPYDPSRNSQEIYDTCAQHPIWQYILQKNDPITALSDALASYADPLFATMFAAIEPLEG